MNIKPFTFALLAGMATISFAQGDLVPTWQRTSLVLLPEQNPVLNQVLKYETFNVNFNELKRSMYSVPRQDIGQIETGYTISLPTPSGRTERFRIAETPVMIDSLAKNLDVRTYRVSGIDDPYAVGRVDVGFHGFHGFVLSPNGSYMIDPVRLGELNTYLTYYRHDAFRNSPFQCYTDGSVAKLGNHQAFGPDSPGGDLKTYRLAMHGTFEYTTFFGGTAALGQAAIVTAVNRVNQVYEVDMAIRMTLVHNHPFDVAADPYTNNNGGAMLTQNQTQTDTDVGNANYDIGHVFSTGGGGIAGLRVVGVTGQKARGVTGLPSPVGDPFYIDYVAHEMGHQYGANHTFNSAASSCGGGNRSAAHAYETGSGSTIMAYAGICPPDNVQNFSDPYFLFDSMTEIWAWRNNAGSGGTAVANGNGIPTANAGADFTIPQGTPYKLIGTGSDPNSDPITYNWEQMNLGTSTLNATDVSTGPLVRSRIALTTGTRFVPRLSTVINNTVDNYEKLSPGNRTMNWRMTVRDNRSGGGAYATDDKVVTVSGAPFVLTAPNGGQTFSGGSTQTVTWTVGGSTAANVRILLSTDGGNNYGTGAATVLLASTPNDGSQSVTLPNITSTQCRIIVEPTDNIYYDMSNTNFTINAVTTVQVNPSAANWAVGTNQTGTFTDLLTSDDQRMTATIGFVVSPAFPTQDLRVTGTTTATTVSALTVTVEASATLAGMEQKIEAFNFVSNSWVNLSTVTATTTDTTYNVAVMGTLSNFLSAGQVRVRVTFRKPTAGPTPFAWQGRVDRVFWTLTP